MRYDDHQSEVSIEKQVTISTQQIRMKSMTMTMKTSETIERAKRRNQQGGEGGEGMTDRQQKERDKERDQGRKKGRKKEVWKLCICMG